MPDKPSLPEPRPPDGQILIYQDGATRLQVRLEGRTVWLSQRLIAELFQVSVKTANEHLVNIYSEGELDPGATIRSFRIVQTEGAREVSRSIDHYNLDAILAVGYRVRSARGTAFRQWATSRLSELLIKGFTLDDERLKEGPTLPVSQTFFATVQNTLHFAIHGLTAAEIIKGRADAAQRHMGLTTWKNAPGGPIRKADVAVAKNYLTQEEIIELNRVVTMYLDSAEDQARRKKPMHMAYWVERLDAFLQFNERNILTHAGSISHELAERHAQTQFEQHEAGAGVWKMPSRPAISTRRSRKSDGWRQTRRPRRRAVRRGSPPESAIRKGAGMRERTRASRMGELFVEKFPRLVAELEECFGEGERLMAVVRKRLGRLSDGGSGER